MPEFLAGFLCGILACALASLLIVMGAYWQLLSHWEWWYE